MSLSRTIDYVFIGGLLLLVAGIGVAQLVRGPQQAEPPTAHPAPVFATVAPQTAPEKINPPRSRTPPPSPDPGLKDSNFLGELATIDQLVESKRLDEALAAADRLVARYGLFRFLSG